MNVLKAATSERQVPQRHVEKQLERDITTPLLRRILITIVVAGLSLSVVGVRPI